MRSGGPHAEWLPWFTCARSTSCRALVWSGEWGARGRGFESRHPDQFFARLIFHRAAGRFRCRRIIGTLGLLGELSAPRQVPCRAPPRGPALCEPSLALSLSDR
jgi:hypothetical protein